MWTLTTFGHIALTGADGRIVASDTRPLLLLAYLVREGCEEYDRGRVAELFWPGAPRKRARSNLRQAMLRIRAHTTPEFLSGGGAAFSVDRSRIRLDVDAWLEDLERGDPAPLPLPAAFLASADQPGGEVEEWIEIERSRLGAEAEAIVARRVRGGIEAGNLVDAAAAAAYWVRLRPAAEEPARALASSLAALGRTIEAHGAYREFELRAEAFEEHPSDDFMEWAGSLREVGWSVPLEAPPPMPAPAPSPAGHGRPPPVGDVHHGPFVSDRADVPGPTRPGWRLLGRYLFPVAGVAVLAAAVGLGIRSAEPALTLELEQASGVSALRLDVGGVRPVVSGKPGYGSSPDGTHLVARGGTDGGIDSRVLTAEGDTVLVFDASADEVVVGWAPDGRQFVLAETTVGDDGVAVHDLTLVDLTGARRSLARLTGPQVSVARWSPDGARLAIRTTDGQVSLYRPDGRLIRRLAGTYASIRWSRTGHELALGEPGMGGGTVRILRPDDGRVLPRMAVPGTPRDMVWLSERYLGLLLLESNGDLRFGLLDLEAVAVAVLPGTLEPRLRFAGVRGRESRGVAEILGALMDRHTLGSGTHVRTVGVQTETAVRAVGESFEVSLALLDQEGRPVVQTTEPVEWEADGEVVRLAERGALQAATAGRGWVRATVAGWRTDTLWIDVEPARSVGSEPVFVEEWHGDPEDGWFLWGAPLPLVVADPADPGGRALLNNGDSNYASGVLSGATFPLDQGLSVRVRAFLPFDGREHQEWGLGLVAADRIDGFRADPHPSLDVTVVARGVTGAWDGTMGHRPLTSRSPGWRTITLQVDSAGVVALLDGQDVVARSRRSLAPGPYRVVLYGRSVDAEVLHGRVEVFEGPVFALPGS
ncbi:MAG: BTAD domain-containing putative transcriptional regulator [Longimicrobiales bacterium]